jgi:hypothetical protein
MIPSDLAEAADRLWISQTKACIDPAWLRLNKARCEIDTDQITRKPAAHLLLGPKVSGCCHAGGHFRAVRQDKPSPR